MLDSCWLKSFLLEQIRFTRHNDYKQLTVLHVLDDHKNNVSTGGNQWILYASLHLIYP